jgi:hypothetical protein
MALSLSILSKIVWYSLDEIKPPENKFILGNYNTTIEYGFFSDSLFYQSVENGVLVPNEKPPDKWGELPKDATDFL